MNAKNTIKKAAMLALAITMLGGCTPSEKKTGDDTKDVATVKWYLPGVVEGKDKKEVFEKVNELMSERYGIKLDIVMIDGGNFSQKMQVANAGREKYDLAYTCNWTNDYYTNVANNANMDLTELLPQYAPTLWANTNSNVWEAVKVDGKIYAVPNWQIQAKSAAVNVRQEYLDMTGFKVEEFGDLDSFERYLTKLHEVKPDCNIVGDMWNYYKYYYGIEPVISEDLPIAVYFDKETENPRIFNQFETKEYADYAQKMYSWVQSGLVTDKYDPSIDAGKVGRSPFGIFLYQPGIAETYSRQYGTKMVCEPISKGVLASSGILATMNSVSATCDQPEKAVQVLEIMNTDKEIYRLLAFGIEGKHYDKVDENQITRKENSGYEGINDWMLGSVMNSYVMSDQAPDVYEQTKKWNDEALVSPIISVNFDTSELTTEMANCQSVLKEQKEMINRGLTEPTAAIAKMNDDLKKAGIDKIIETLNAQIEAQLQK